MRYLSCLLKLSLKYLKYLSVRKELPSHVEMLYGPISNNNGFAVEPRLTGEYADYMTYDNSLWGDDNWKACHDYKSSESMTAWLDRNTLYTFKRDSLGMPIQIEGRVQTGNQNINHHTGVFGTLRIKQANGAWQYKCVKPFMGKILVLNFGWLLDDPSQERALFMCSPRLK